MTRLPFLLLSLAYLFIRSQTFAQEARDTTYDFKPAEDVIFEDDFKSDKLATFPHKWDSAKGEYMPLQRGAVRKQDGVMVFDMPYGNGALALPKFDSIDRGAVKATFEFDYILLDSQAAVGACFFFRDGGRHWLSLNYNGSMFEDYVHREDDGKPYVMYPGSFNREKWHHFAVSFAMADMQCYVDHKKTWSNTSLNTAYNRRYVLCDIPKYFYISGRAPLAIRNVRFAQTVLRVKKNNGFDKLLSEKKFVTHAILFDVDKADIKPESVGFVKELAQWLQKNGTVKLEIDGHTDSDGTKESNRALSQRRAEAVRSMLVAEGVSVNRLSAKGYGSGKPIDNNSTLVGKANNRRVEFILL